MTAVHSVAGTLRDDTPLITRPPFVDPHHSASLAGRRRRRVRRTSGPAASASRTAGCCSSTRRRSSGRPCWTRCVSRWSRERCWWPGHPARCGSRRGSSWCWRRIPCPCAVARDVDCVCPSGVRRRYLGRLSGPLLDRVDIRVDLPPLDPVDAGRRRTPTGEPSRGGRGAGAARARAVGASVARARRGAARRRCPGRWCAGVAAGPAGGGPAGAGGARPGGSPAAASTGCCGWRSPPRISPAGDSPAPRRWRRRWRCAAGRRRDRRFRRERGSERAWAGLLRSCEPPSPPVASSSQRRGAVAAWEAIVTRRAPRAVLAATAARSAGLAGGRCATGSSATSTRPAAVGRAGDRPGRSTDWPADAFVGFQSAAGRRVRGAAPPRRAVRARAAAAAVAGPRGDDRRVAGVQRRTGSGSPVRWRTRWPGAA